MSRRHELDNHRERLNEIRGIMNSMKVLAVMQTHKLDRFIRAQTTINQTIEEMAADFLKFHPELLPAAETSANIIILVGSEHGFCGAFNQRLLEQLHKSFYPPQQQNKLIAIGSKLHPLLENLAEETIYIEGAHIADEINRVVEQLASSLSDYPQATSLYVIHHNGSDASLQSERLLPPFRNLEPSTPSYTHPALLNLPAAEFIIELTEHYLFHSLHRILYRSLMIENQQRIQHLENAANHLDHQTEELGHKINALRQEEIIEEIEVILLNIASQ